MDLSRIKKILKDNGFDPRKSLGQNFLYDRNIRQKIISRLNIPAKATVLEIGPGLGAMTFDLARISRNVIAVDKDARVCRIMGDAFSRANNIELINADILETDLAQFAEEGQKIVVYGNIPYYISTPIIEHLLSFRDHISDIYLLMQEELADRLSAGPGSRVYGSISCFVQYYADVKKLFRVPRNCFYPRPGVESSLLRISINTGPAVDARDPGLMFEIIRRAFSQRRKKMLNPLSSWDRFPNIDKRTWRDLLGKSGIPENARAESVALSEFARLSDLLADPA